MRPFRAGYCPSKGTAVNIHSLIQQLLDPTLHKPQCIKCTCQKSPGILGSVLAPAQYQLRGHCTSERYHCRAIHVEDPRLGVVPCWVQFLTTTQTCVAVRNVTSKYVSNLLFAFDIRSGKLLRQLHARTLGGYPSRQNKFYDHTLCSLTIECCCTYFVAWLTQL